MGTREQWAMAAILGLAAFYFFGLNALYLYGVAALLYFLTRPRGSRRSGRR